MANVTAARPIEIGHSGAIPYAEAQGGRPAIVVVSGGNAFMAPFDERRARRDLRRIARLFPDGATVCIAGYDISEPHPTADEMADAVAALIRDRFGRAIVAGVSFGGFVAARVAARHPDIAEKLILLASGARFSVEGRARVERQIADAARGDLYAMAVPFAALFRRPWLNVLVRLSLWLQKRSLARRFNDRPVLVRMLEAGLRASDEGAPPSHAPTLVVGGTRDPYFDRASMDALAGAEVVLFDRETHTVPLERPRDVARVIERFLSR